MRITKLKLVLPLLAILAAVGLSLGGLASPTPPEPPAPQKDPATPPAPAAVAVAPAPRVAGAKEFDELTVAIRHSGLSNELSSSLKIEADGTCWYEVAGRPAIGDSPAWTPAKIKHKLSADQLRRLGALLKETDWLAKAAPKEFQLHDSEYTLTLKREGKATTLSCMGEHGDYKALLAFLRGISSQEYLVYQLEWEPATMTEGRQKLNSFLGHPVGRPPFEIDYNRFVPWATRLVRNPFDRPTEDVVTAIRLVSFLKLESEREYLADLATDRNAQVREAVVGAMARLGGEKSVAVLRKMVRSTSDAPWELINLGPLAVPAIAEVIRDSDPEVAERMVRAYLDHWAAVPKPIDEKVLDAVRSSMADPKVKKYRTEYHEKLLKLAAEKEKDRK